MPTQEINSTDWPIFCDRFNRLHRGTLVTIETADSSGRKTAVAREFPLQEVLFDRSSCSDSLSFILDCPHRREMRHEITQPIHFRVKQNGEGTKYLQIDAESGTSLVHFRSGKLGEILEGLELV